MAWDKNKPAGTDKIRVSDDYIRANWAALETALGADLNMGLTSQVIWLYADALNAAMSACWSIVAAVGDSLLAIKGGATYTTGGTSAGTWTQPSHTLTKAEIPKHTHGGVNIIADGAYRVQTGFGPNAWYAKTGTYNFLSEDGTADGVLGNSHNHGITYRPLARVGLLIQKL